MTSRILPPEEWTALAGTGADVCAGLNPCDTHILVVEDGHAIIGTWTLTRVVHAECLWIRADHRQRASVGRRLWMLMRQMARTMGASVVWTGAISDDVKTLIGKVGGIPVPGESYLLPMGGDSCRRLS